MSALRTAAQQALEALHEIGWSNNTRWQSDRAATVIPALRAALAEEALQRFTDVNQEIEAALAEPESCQYPDCVDNGPEGKCTRWLLGECSKSEDYKPQRPAEPVQEPVAWMTPGQDLHLNNGEGFRFSDWTPLYTAPPQRKPLTEEEISAIDWKAGETLHDFARAVEQAHGITS